MLINSVIQYFKFKKKKDLIKLLVYICDSIEKMDYCYWEKYDKRSSITLWAMSSAYMHCAM